MKTATSAIDQIAELKLLLYIGVFTCGISDKATLGTGAAAADGVEIEEPDSACSEAGMTDTKRKQVASAKTNPIRFAARGATLSRSNRII